jgi:dipeptidyl aminopeptidase/acylaminoacyl peptidase
MVVYEYPAKSFPARAGSNRVSFFGGENAGEVFNLHLLTTRGYAVLLPDVPVVFPDTTMLKATWRSIAGGVDESIALGVADSNRLGVMGHSFGGYGALSTLVVTSRFRAGVALSGGYYDMAGQCTKLQEDGSSAYARYCIWMLNCALWECPATYLANSPLFLLDRVRTPLLLIQGGADEATAPVQAEQAFATLRALGRETDYALYPGGGHNYGQWSVAQQEDVVRRVIAWLDAHLKQ